MSIDPLIEIAPGQGARSSGASYQDLLDLETRPVPDVLRMQSAREIPVVKVPIERYRWVPAASVDLENASDRLDGSDGPWPGSLPAPAPAMVPEQPIAAELLDGTGEQVRVSGRGEISAQPASIVVGSRRHQVVAGYHRGFYNRPFLFTIIAVPQTLIRNWWGQR